MAVQDDINQAAAALTSLVNTVGTVAADLVALRPTSRPTSTR